MTHKYSGKSLLELRDHYGIGSKGFYEQSWYLNEEFAKEKAPKGTYELDLSNDLANLSYLDRIKKLKKGYEVAPLPVVVEAILEHFKKTGERLCENYWLLTSSVDSGASRVYVGYFGVHGLYVGYWIDDDRVDDIGVASARKSKKLELKNLDSFDPSDFESRILKLEKFKDKVEKIIRL